MEALRARFDLPKGTSSAALERVLRQLSPEGEDAGERAETARDDDDGSFAGTTCRPFDDDEEATPTREDARERAVMEETSPRARAASLVEAVAEARRARGEDRRASGRGDAEDDARAKDAERMADIAREDARMAQRHASALKLEVRAREGKIKALREENERLRRENRALRHARVAATVRKTTSEAVEASVGTTTRAPEDASVALHRAWGKLCESAAKGNADVGLLMRQYKSTRRERTLAYERAVELEEELTKTRETLRALEVKTRENARAYATAEAIIDEEADEKLTLRRKLKEATEDRAELVVRVETQRDAMDGLRASEQRLRDEVFRLEKQLVRAGTLRDKFRATCHELEACERERDERGQRLAHVDAECDMLAHMVRELRKSSGTDPREFMLAVERALASHDDAPETSPREEVEQSSPSPQRSDVEEGYDTPDEDVDDGARDDAHVSFVDDDFPSPPISGIVDATRTPDSAGSTAFHF